MTSRPSDPLVGPFRGTAIGAYLLNQRVSNRARILVFASIVWQGDEAAEESAWDKRPRHQPQQHLVVAAAAAAAAALGQTPRSKGLDSRGQRFSSDGEALAPFGDHLYHQRQQPPHPITVPVEPAFGGATAPDVTAFDRLRYHALGDTELAASSMGLRCGGGVQAGVPQPPVGGIGEGAGAAVGWGSGKFQAVPAARFL